MGAIGASPPMLVALGPKRPVPVLVVARSKSKPVGNGVLRKSQLVCIVMPFVGVSPLFCQIGRNLQSYSPMGERSQSGAMPVAKTNARLSAINASLVNSACFLVAHQSVMV